MPYLPIGPAVRARLICITFVIFSPALLQAHEAWLLTPEEIEVLATAPIPGVFASHLWLGVAAALGGAFTLAALRLEIRLSHSEHRLCAPMVSQALSWGPVALRCGLAAMLALAALGGLPRHGTAMWTEPTLLVPDMQLNLVPGWTWLALVQFGLAIALVAGILTRWIGGALIALAALGLVLFGVKFLSYAPHFMAPGLMLILAGAGAVSVDRWIGRDGWLSLPPRVVGWGWRLAQVLIGAGFVYLAVAHKLLQPTLIVAILEHSNLPTLGLPLPVVALIMTGIEIICGVLLILGRLVRPVAVLLICAITVLAMGLAETPLFHANLYGMMVFLALSGRAMPWPGAARAPLRRMMA